VDDVGRRIEGDGAAFSDHDHAAPSAGGADGSGAGFSVGGAIDCALDTAAAGEVADFLNIVGAGTEYVIAEAESAGQLKALIENVDADDLFRAEFAAQCASSEADRAKAGDEHCVVATDADLLEALVDGAESAPSR